MGSQIVDALAQPFLDTAEAAKILDYILQFFPLYSGITAIKYDAFYCNDSLDKQLIYIIVRSISPFVFVVSSLVFTFLRACNNNFFLKYWVNEIIRNYRHVYIYVCEYMCVYLCFFAVR